MKGSQTEAWPKPPWRKRMGGVVDFWGGSETRSSSLSAGRRAVEMYVLVVLCGRGWKSWVFVQRRENREERASSIIG